MSQGEGEPFDELDSLETVQALLLTDEDRVYASVSFCNRYKLQ